MAHRHSSFSGNVYSFFTEWWKNLRKRKIYLQTITITLNISDEKLLVWSRAKVIWSINNISAFLTMHILVEFYFQNSLKPTLAKSLVAILLVENRIEILSSFWPGPTIRSKKTLKLYTTKYLLFFWEIL